MSVQLQQMVCLPLMLFRPSTCSALPGGGPGGRTKRTIEYRTEADKWDYIGGARRLPGIWSTLGYITYPTKHASMLVQWSAWLTHTRHRPPTLEVSTEYCNEDILFSFFCSVGVTARHTPPAESSEERFHAWSPWSRRTCSNACSSIGDFSTRCSRQHCLANWLHACRGGWSTVSTLSEGISPTEQRSS